MITEVGSVFPVDTLYGDETHEKYTKEEFGSFLNLDKNVLFLSLGREAFSIIAYNHSANKKVLLPMYTCQTVVDPFVELGWEFDTYSIDTNLRINIQNLKEKLYVFKPGVAVFHPYYGTFFTQEEIEAIREVKSNGVIIVVDYTQCIYNKEHIDHADYVVGSLRKWFDSPDGGYIYSRCQDISAYGSLSENMSFVIPQIDSMYLRGRYFKTGDQGLKDISIRLNKQAVSVAGKNIEPHALSIFGMNRLLNADVVTFGKIRLSNYAYLYNHLFQTGKVKFVYNDIGEVVSSPLYFPIYCENRGELQKKLAENSVYAPILWERPEFYTCSDESSSYIYDHILVIPIDQRYGIDEMKRVCKIINSFSKED